MRYFVIIDSYGLMSALPSMAPERGEVIFFVAGNRKSSSFQLPETGDEVSIYNFSDISKYRITGHDRVIVHIRKTEMRKNVISLIRASSPTVPILVLDCPHQYISPDEKKSPLYAGVISLPVHSILKSKSDEKWHQIELKKKVIRMRRVVDADKPLWILTQRDPDPDALASALALKALLGRSNKNAVIVTLKPVSRNENISMINILGITVKTVKPAEIEKAPQLAMVDVQPGYFNRSFKNLRLVVDHHPVVVACKAPFKDLQITYGATATIFTEYLTATEMKIGQRLATALYYAIKTDTLLLGREVSRADFNAFSFLWAKANHQQISQMERPRLRSKEVHVFIKALKEHSIESGCIFAGLGKVPKDDIVPRLADFILQIGEAEFSLVWGIVNKEIIFSARSLTPLIHAGEVLHSAFGHIGSAGGHRSMAGATIPASKLMKEMGLRFTTRLGASLKKRILKIVLKQKKEHKRDKRNSR